jgi:lambda family phage portal protein
VQAKAIVERYSDSVVDTGLRLEATPEIETLGITPEKAEEWSRKVESAFHIWAKSKTCLRDRSMNFYQAQRLVSTFQQRDNDYFVRFFYSAEKDLLNPLQLGFVDPNQIKSDSFTPTYGIYDNQDGIIVDGAGREKAYQVWYYKNGKYISEVVPAVGRRSKRRMMIHGYQPEYAGQRRGYPRYSQALQYFENMTDFELSTIKKAINQSSITMYVKPSQDNPASNPLEDMTHVGPAGPSAADSDGDGVVDNGEAFVKYCPLPEATMTNPGSVGVFSLQEGEDLKAFTGDTPSDTYESFVNAFTSHLCASMSIPLEVLLMKFNQNYSASRAALILFWRVAQIWREELAADFLNAVYEEWLYGEIAAGRIAAPGWEDPRMRAAWLSNNWIGAPMPNIDPRQTAAADKAYLEMGAQTLKQVARNWNGSSAESNRMKLKREMAELTVPPWNETTKGL